MRLLLFAIFFGCSVLGSAQSVFQKNSVSDQRHVTYAFVNGFIYTENEKLENVPLLIKEGKIISVGSETVIPEHAVKIDLKGRYVYPSFIDLYSDYGVPTAKDQSKTSKKPQYHPKKPGAFGANDAIHTERHAAEFFTPDDKKAEALRKAGIGTVLTQQHDGIFRGTAALALTGEGPPNDLILKPYAATGWSFDKGTSKQQYPTSLMGAIALIRQTLLDVYWYHNLKTPSEVNLSLQQLYGLLDLPAVFATTDYLSGLRAAKLSEEFEYPFILKGAGD